MEIKLNPMLKIALSSLFSIGIFFFSWYFLGFFYERYESTFTVLGSGALTPGMKYDDLYYFSHILFIKAYAQFFTYLPQFQWLSIFQYLYMIISFGVILHVFFNTRQGVVLLVLSIILVSSFFADNFINFLYTRVSFVAGFAAIYGIIFSKHMKKLTLKIYLSYLLLFIIGMLTRPESAFLILAFSALFYFFILDNYPFTEKIKTSLRLFTLPIIGCLMIFLWFAYDISVADEFYKKIEPDVEYEITARNNIVPLSQMETRKDSLRHTAIDIVLWGDATTNDAEFLRSLMLHDSYDLISKTLFNFAIDTLKSSLEKNLPVVYFNLFIFLFVLLFLIFEKSHKYYYVLIYQFVFYFLIFLVSYRIKMTETAIFTIFFSASILYLTYLLLHAKPLSLIPKTLLSIGLIVFTVFQISSLNAQSKMLHEDYQQNKINRMLVEEKFNGKNLFLNNEASHIFLQSFKPFEIFDFSSFNQFYLYGEQHITSIEPYRTYLSRLCECDPNHYGEFFNFVKEGGSQNVFMMSEHFMHFISEYLLIVHDLNIEWKELPHLTIQTKKLYDDELFELKFYSPHE